MVTRQVGGNLIMIGWSIQFELSFWLSCEVSADFRRRIFCWMIVLTTIPALAQTSDQPAQRLELNQSISGELRHTDRDSFELQLRQGQLLKVTVTCQNFIPILTLYSGDGNKLIEAQFFKSPVNGQLFFQTDRAGTYKVGIAGEEDLQEAVGSYELEARVIAQPNANDLAYTRTLLLQQKFWPLLSKDTPESLNELLLVTNEALGLSRSLGERSFEANALTFRAEAYKAKEQFDSALENFKQALAILRELGVPSRIAGSLIPIGQIYAARSDYQRALDYYLEALPLFDKQKMENMVGWSLTNIGHVYSAYGEQTKAMEYYQKSYACYDHFTAIAAEKPIGMGVALSSMANIYLALGEKQQALDHLKKSLEHFKIGHNTAHEHLAYARMGEIYTSLGDYQQAASYLEKARQYFHDSRSLSEANVQSSLGNFYKSKGDYQQALESLQSALTIRRSLGNRRGQAQTLTNIGAVYALQRQFKNAFHQYSEAQMLWQEIGDKYSEGTTLNYLGLNYYELKDTGQAREYFNRALTLNRTTNDREGEANTLYNLARLDCAAENFKLARQQMEAALAITEAVRATVDSEDLRASYLATVKNYYEFYVDLLMQLHRREPTAGHDDEALQASEMAHARSLSETLANTRRQLRQGIAPAVLKREQELQQRLNAKAEYQRKLVGNKAMPELLQAAELEIQALTAELQEMRTALNASNPQDAALSLSQPLTVREIQRTLLDENTLLLSYSLGRERSYLWVVSNTGLKSYELPKGEIIEAAARHFYKLLKHYGQPPVFTNLSEKQKWMIQLEEETTEVAAALSRLIVQPAATEIIGKRLMIVADGALQYVPFGALPEMMEGDNNRSPLIINHEIVNLPSANSLALLRREMKTRQPAAKTIAIFADPVFTADDSRLLNARQKGSRLLTSPDLDQALRDVGENSTSLHRLPFTRREADSIINLVAARDRKTALNFAASRANALDEKLSDYRILHFATHGILNSTHPDLSGLVLSLVNEKGQPQDGFFRLHEIYNLKLNADLVVLSACQTGLGKEVKGEGLIGLTRGFMYAGAPRVIASLWKVNDSATAELMKIFYQKMLGEKKLSAAAALRAAQVELLQQKRWAHPSFWAAFTLQGEWK